MCGGTLEIATCSHVGHVFRKSTPYTFPGGTSRIVNHNNARLAEVWLDQWKYFYYNINPGSTNTSICRNKRANYNDACVLNVPFMYSLACVCLACFFLSGDWHASCKLHTLTSFMRPGTSYTYIRYPLTLYV